MKILTKHQQVDKNGFLTIKVESLENGMVMMNILLIGLITANPLNKQFVIDTRT